MAGVRGTATGLAAELRPVAKLVVIHYQSLKRAPGRAVVGAAAPEGFFVGKSGATARNTSYNKDLLRFTTLAGTEGESPHSPSDQPGN